MFLEKPYVLKKYQDKYQHVLVDEFQDTNYTQYSIIKLLCSPNSLNERSLVVVGDDSQSIYKFRGAAISNILEFKEDYGNPKIITLNENYRSTQEILDVSYKVIQNNNPYTLESKLGISKKLIANGRVSSKDSNIRISNCKDLDSEVAFVINGIKDFLSKEPDKTFKDIAILVRANSHNFHFRKPKKHIFFIVKLFTNDIFDIIMIEHLLHFTKNFVLDLFWQFTIKTLGRIGLD